LCRRWQAYKRTTPAGVQYSRGCPGYRAWPGKLALGMRQSHRAGETLWVDDVGQGRAVVNPRSGAGPEVAIFVAVLGASHSTYAEATGRQRLPPWIGSPVRTLAARGGVPAVMVPEPRKAAVTRAHRDAPESTRTEAALAPHDGVAVIPARAAKPRDKAKGEVGVHVVERGLLARLRHPPCCSLAAVKAALQPLSSALKARPFKTLPGSRQALLDALERPGLRPLPLEP
jgi:transposase